VIAALVLVATLIAILIATGLGRRLRGLSQAAELLGRGEVPVIDRTTRISGKSGSCPKCCMTVRSSCRTSALRSGPMHKPCRRPTSCWRRGSRQRTAELEASREEALAAARAKAAFLATMSHEIRTPLNGVVGMSTLLAETPLDAEQRDYLQTIRLSSDQLLAVISDILDFSKIESGKLELEAEPLSVRGAVEEACDIAAPRAREKGLELIIDIADGPAGGMPTPSGETSRGCARC
jgi:signal transduction histidine kinase